jgi:NADH-quinone oxidoreductase subunit L
MVFLTFFGEAKYEVNYTPGNGIRLPLIVLACLSLVGGIVELPHTLGGQPWFSEFMGGVLPALHYVEGQTHAELVLQIVAAVVSLSGIYLAYLFFLRRRVSADGVARSMLGAALDRFWFGGWGFDWLYNKLFVTPYIWLARTNKDDFIDSIYDGIAKLNEVFYRALSRTETGKVRWYMTGIALGAIVAIAIAVFL